jgi:hypothetical protein
MLYGEPDRSTRDLCSIGGIAALLGGPKLPRLVSPIQDSQTCRQLRNLLIHSNPGRLTPPDSFFSLMEPKLSSLPTIRHISSVLQLLAHTTLFRLRVLITACIIGFSQHSAVVPPGV